ncbi:MAG: glycosyltransferase, partial [Gemmataceae bacterium]|nr:glycosyltransferase [Gemmataceae bacterium]
MYGGVETYLATLARCRELCPALEPHFGLCFPGRCADELRDAGAPVHNLGPVRLSRPWTLWRARRRLKSLLRATRFDAAITHGSWPHAAFAPVVARAGVGLANAVHGLLDAPGWLDRRAARTPPAVVLANSRFTAGPAAKLFPKARVEVVYLPVAGLGVSPDRDRVRADVRAELQTPADAVVILQAARLERWKGQAVTLDALCRLKDVPNWAAWIAGGAQRPDEVAFLAELQARADRG